MVPTLPDTAERGVVPTLGREDSIVRMGLTGARSDGGRVGQSARGSRDRVSSLGRVQSGEPNLSRLMDT
jgi:hypothetical protein